jgi:DNA-binding NarL/FixJ family response regulator
VLALATLRVTAGTGLADTSGIRMITMPRIRLVLVDDHPIVLRGLQQLLAQSDDCEVVASCADADTGFAAVQRCKPDVLLVDLRMPHRDGLALLRALSAAAITCPAIVLTAAIDNAQVSEAVRLGARGLVLKDSPPDTVIECVRRVHAGEESFDLPSVTRALTATMQRESAARDALAVLTHREIEIIQMVAQGLRNRAIAARLSISEGTVKVHLHNVYEKLQIDGRLGLTLYAQQHGLVP